MWSVILGPSCGQLSESDNHTYASQRSISNTLKLRLGLFFNLTVVLLAIDILRLRLPQQDRKF